MIGGKLGHRSLRCRSSPLRCYHGAMRALITALMLTACVQPTPPPSAPTPMTTAAAPSTTLGPLPLDPARNTRHLVISPLRRQQGTNARITIASSAGTDTIERALPACIELPPLTRDITIVAPVEHLAVGFTYDDEPSFDDACARAREPFPEFQGSE